MTHQILFIQGGGEGAHDRWDNLLAESLRRALGSACEVRFPRMPNEADPNYTRWKTALAEEFAKLDDGAILLGHSIGGTILINVLADEPPAFTLRGIFLVAAPFKPRSDLGKRLPSRVPVHLYHGSDDETVPVEHVDLYNKVIPQARVHRLAGRDHQLNNDLSEVAAEIRRLL